MREGARETTRTTLVELPEGEGARRALENDGAFGNTHGRAGVHANITDERIDFLHWGVIRGDDAVAWHVLPRELFPPRTTVYKEGDANAVFKDDKTDDCFRRRGEGDSFR